MRRLLTLSVAVLLGTAALSAQPRPTGLPSQESRQYLHLHAQGTHKL